MATSIRNARPTYHSLRADAPVGSAPQVFLLGDYANTVTQVHRHNTKYWTVTTREARNAFSNPTLGVSAQVWFDQFDGRYVVDYHADGLVGIEITRTLDARAALGAAITHTTETGHLAGRW